MEFNKLEYYLSESRLNRFLVASGNSKIKAQKMYDANLRLAQSFYPILNLFEIFFRNSCNYQVSSHFQNSDWIIAEKNGFMSNTSLTGSKFFLKNSILNAEKTIKRKGGLVTSGKVIAEQSLGFWTSLFDTHHYRLIGGIVIHVFRQKPAEINRYILSQKLNKVREFRNRVYHNEPICFNDNDFDFTYAESIKDEIYELLSWIDSDLSNYVIAFDKIKNKIDLAKSILILEFK